jgi:hypothetical protein
MRTPDDEKETVKEIYQRYKETYGEEDDKYSVRAIIEAQKNGFLSPDVIEVIRTIVSRNGDINFKRLLEHLQAKFGDDVVDEYRNQILYYSAQVYMAKKKMLRDKSCMECLQGWKQSANAGRGGLYLY